MHSFHQLPGIILLQKPTNMHESSWYKKGKTLLMHKKLWASMYPRKNK